MAERMEETAASGYPVVEQIQTRRERAADLRFLGGRKRSNRARDAAKHLAQLEQPRSVRGLEAHLIRVRRGREHGELAMDRFAAPLALAAQPRIDALDTA